MTLKKTLLAGMACLVVTAGGASAADFTFKYGNAQPESAIRSQSMKFFEEELEKRSGGRIEVENFFSGVLGNEREMMDQVTTGLLQGTRGGMFAEANPKYSIFLLPFLVENWDQMECLVGSDFTKKVQADAANQGYHIPATGISQGFRAHTNNVRPLTKVADLKGLKMRVPQQEVYIETSKALGASPQAMPFSEAYQAFKTGVIDGQDNPPANIWDFKIQEVQKFMTITNYSTGPDPLIVNEEWYKGLPDDLKKIFDDVAVEAMAKSDELYRKAEGDLIKELGKSMEINYVEGDALAEFQAAVKPVYDTFVAKGAFSMADVEAAKTAARSCK
ncbi:TRAP transporter substrate-binding protein [Cohaesibacter gelatinilyticus]|uniref:Tripartite ATP-independent transporter solute receptor, DctP family n=1 Tax=Cohaesibacter gelatinilyticus TaxID=372072 RepID=A0A285NM55_9HYPH|nr:TRAP transporter substrate-binding protein [Cohaesibacter gelatinilyticus]SNZ08711.1 tripartite ATP-independent transporter solute receptor, DctP family [Cohaesibacter gelatinilyticus]